MTYIWVRKTKRCSSKYDIDESIKPICHQLHEYSSTWVTYMFDVIELVNKPTPLVTLILAVPKDDD